MKLEELQRRNYSAVTTRNYLRVVADFAKYFGKSPDKLGPNELRTYQAYLLQDFLHTREGSQPRLSRQIPRSPQTSPPPPSTMLCRSGRRSRRPTAVRQNDPPSASPRHGGLRQARFRWTHAGVALSGPLPPSCGYFQSSLVGLRARAGDLALEELRPRRQARQDDPCGH